MIRSPSRADVLKQYKRSRRKIKELENKNCRLTHELNRVKRDLNLEKVRNRSGLWDINNL
jgi:hypothetical protein